VSKIKILHIIKSLGRGGAETLLLETLKAHDKNRFEFSYIYFLPWKNQMVESLEREGAQVHCFNAKNVFGMVLSIPAIIRFVQGKQVQIIHCHLPWSGVIARIVGKLVKIPIVYTEHSVQERYKSLTRRANLLTLGLNNRTIAVSTKASESIKNFKGKKFPITTIKNGVDTVFFSQNDISKKEARRMLNIRDEEIVIGNVCGLRVEKGLQNWVRLAGELVKRNKNLKFLLVGDGPVKTEIVDLIKTLMLTDYFIMPGLQRNVKPYLDAMDIFWITSKFEGLPIALLEAMSMEKPIVTTAAGGIGEAVEYGITGFITPVELPDQTLEGVEKLIASGPLRKEIGLNARKKVVKAFNIDTMVKEIEMVYLDLFPNFSSSRK
jgi:glycosyltransferase involved in cell wall biosynthesis